MEAILQTLMTGLPAFLAQSATTLAMLLAGAMIYLWLTPHREIELVRAGNVAAAISFGGAILGLAIPLSFCLAFSVSVLDILVWGSVTLVLQLIAFRVVDLVLRNLSQRIEEGDVAGAVFLLLVKLSTAAVNAAAVSG